jgi:hypothetical protein
VEISICSPNRINTCIEVHSGARGRDLNTSNLNVVLGFYSTNVQVVLLALWVFLQLNTLPCPISRVKGEWSAWQSDLALSAQDKNELIANINITILKALICDDLRRGSVLNSGNNGREQIWQLLIPRVKKRSPAGGVTVDHWTPRWLQLQSAL